MSKAGSATPSRRLDPRAKTFDIVDLTTPDGQCRGHILNLSQAGALLHTKAAQKTGSLVAIALGDEPVLASVQWSDGAKSGVKFARRLASDDVASMLAPAKKAAPQR